MKVIRPWTKLEEQRAVTFRSERHTIGSIARLLNRSYGSVSMRLHLLGVTRRVRCRRKRGQFLKDVAATCRRGLSDREVAAILDTWPSEVFRARRKLGIPAGVTLSDAARRRNSKRYSPHRCYLCNARCPLRGRKVGWQLRRIGCWKNGVWECYCPSCFAAHGWPSVPRRVKLSRESQSGESRKRVYSLLVPQ